MRLLWCVSAHLSPVRLMFSASSEHSGVRDSTNALLYQGRVPVVEGGLSVAIVFDAATGSAQYHVGTDAGLYLNFAVTNIGISPDTGDAAFFLKYRNVYYNDSDSLFVGSMGETPSAAIPGLVQITSTNLLSFLCGDAAVADSLPAALSK